MKHVIRKETVIIKNLTADGTGVRKFLFPDNENLRNAKLWGLQLFYIGFDSLLVQSEGTTGGQIQNDPDYNQYLIDKDTFQRSFITLCDNKNVKFLNQSPCVIFQTIQNGPVGDPTFSNQTVSLCEVDTKTFAGQILDLNNSYLQICEQDLKSFYGRSIILNFYYSRTDLENVMMKKLN